MYVSEYKRKKLTGEEIKSIRHYATGYIIGDKTHLIDDNTIEEIYNIREELAYIHNNKILPLKKALRTIEKSIK